MVAADTAYDNYDAVDTAARADGANDRYWGPWLDYVAAGGTYDADLGIPRELVASSACRLSSSFASAFAFPLPWPGSSRSCSKPPRR